MVHYLLILYICKRNHIIRNAGGLQDRFVLFSGAFLICSGKSRKRGSFRKKKKTKVTRIELRHLYINGSYSLRLHAAGMAAKERFHHFLFLLIPR